MLGSLTFYRRILHENFFSDPSVVALTTSSIQNAEATGKRAVNKLPTIGHAIAGVMAGATVSFIAAPVEHIKARLQIQYSVDKTKRLYSGPIDCTKKIVSLNHNSFTENSRYNTNSTEPTASVAFTTVYPPPSCSAPFSSSGGVPTTSSPASSPHPLTYPRRPSTSGPAASPPRSSGSHPTHPTSSSSAS